MKKFKLQQKKISESEIQSGIVDLLAMFGYEVFRMPIGPVVHRLGKGDDVRTFWKRHPLKGFPDLFTFSKKKTGRLITIECKRMGKDPEPHQQEWHDRLTALGCICIVGRDPVAVVNEIKLRDV